MNEDFALLLTPANARRLLRLSQACDMTIANTEELLEIAATDTIPYDAFDPFVCPHSLTRETITQFLLDNNLRGIVQQDYHPDFNEIALMNTVRLRRPEFVSVFTNREKVWKDAAKACLPLGVNVDVCRHYTMTGENIDKRRSGILIIDNDATSESSPHKLRAFASEFASTLYFDGLRGFDLIPPWTLPASMMNPTMPTSLYPRTVSDVGESYKKSLYLFAPLYGVCLFPELIDHSKDQYLADKYLHTRLQRYRPSMDFD